MNDKQADVLGVPYVSALLLFSVKIIPHRTLSQQEVSTSGWTCTIQLGEEQAGSVFLTRFLFWMRVRLLPGYPPAHSLTHSRVKLT